MSTGSQMTNVFEALQRARKERDDAERISSAAPGALDSRRVSPAIEAPRDAATGFRETRATPFRDIKGTRPPGDAAEVGYIRDSDVVPIEADASLRYHF